MNSIRAAELRNEQTEERKAEWGNRLPSPRREGRRGREGETDQSFGLLLRCRSCEQINRRGGRENNESYLVEDEVAAVVAGELGNAGEGDLGGVVEVVDDDDAEALLEQLQHGVAADVPGAARHQDGPQHGGHHLQGRERTGWAAREEEQGGRRIGRSSAAVEWSDGLCVRWMSCTAPRLLALCMVVSCPACWFPWVGNPHRLISVSYIAAPLGRPARAGPWRPGPGAREDSGPCPACHDDG